jgi:hypothetical protein
MELPELNRCCVRFRQKLRVHRRGDHPISWVLPNDNSMKSNQDFGRASLDQSRSIHTVSASTMITFRRAFLTLSVLGLAAVSSGCCITSISSRKVCEQPAAACYEQPIPQGIGPENAPVVAPIPPDAPAEQPPQPFVPPAPSSAKGRMGVRTTKMIREFGDSVRDTLTRS